MIQTRCLFRVILYITSVLHQGYGSSCTSGFPSLEQLRSMNNIVFSTGFPLQGVHPSLQITCNGTLTQFVYTTFLNGAVVQSEFFDIWRETTPGSRLFQIVSPSISRVNEVLFENLNNTRAIYKLNVSIPVQEGDFIGFSSFVRSTFKFLDWGPGGAPGSVFTNQMGTLLNLDSVIFNTQYSPLITAVVLPSVNPSDLERPSTSVINLTPTSTASTTISTISEPSPTPMGNVRASDTDEPITLRLPSSKERSNRTVIIATGCVCAGGIILALLLVALCVACLVVRKRKMPGQSLRNRVRENQKQGISIHMDDIGAAVVPKPSKTFDGDDESLESNSAYVASTRYDVTIGADEHFLSPYYHTVVEVGDTCNTKNDAVYYTIPFGSTASDLSQNDQCHERATTYTNMNIQSNLAYEATTQILLNKDTVTACNDHQFSALTEKARGYKISEQENIYSTCGSPASNIYSEPFKS